jgi:two-component system cell cycle sensor histidine kinase/response regulator CckA
MPHEILNTILCIDDSPDKLELIALMLRQTGYQVATAIDAREGLKIARLQPPDMIISDVSMPGMDGIELCRRVRADQKLHTVPIILITALRKDTDSVLAGLQAGADDYLEAPFDPMRLIAKVGRLIERKRMEDIVRERERYYRTLIENAYDLISILNADGSMRYQSPSLGRLLGYNPEELIDKSVFDFIHPDDKDKAHLAFDNSLLSPTTPIEAELRFLHKNGSWSYFVCTLTNLLDDPSISGIISNAFDITERKQAQQELLVREVAKRRLAERQTAILNALPSQLCLISGDGNILDTNIKWKEFALSNNYHGGNLGVGSNYLAVCDSATGEGSDGAKEVAQGIRAVISGKSKRFELDYPCHSPDEQRWFKLMVAPIHDDPSEGVVIMHVNITESVLAKIALSDMTLELEAAIHAYRQVLSNSLDVICTMDADGRFIQASAAAKDVWGYQPEELIGKRYMELVHPDDRDRTILVATEIMAGTATSNFDNRYLRKDGSVVDIMWSANWSEADGAMFCVARDVSQIKRAERALEQSAEQLRQAQKLESVGRLAGGIAHDFNNMLTAIQGYSELTLRRLETNDPMRRNIEEIRKAGERSAALTRQLLAFSRQQILQPVVLNLNDAINNIVTMLHRLIGEDVQLVTSLNRNITRVKVDPGQLSQIIINLAVNARDAMPQGGKLTIETANVFLSSDYARQHLDVLPGDYVMLAISDNGTGMSAETQAHIFDPFFTTKEVGKGTGLGLATVYGIVKQSGGHIWVYSEDGVGTTFKIYLPQVIEQAEQAKAEDTSNDFPGGTETILLVEDEEIVRRLTCRMLEDCGYTVLEACNGVEALSMYEEHDQRIDLLMTDVVMPQIGGRKLAESLVPIYPYMRILYTSGYTDDAVVRHGVIDAGTNFIQKPYTPHGLARKVREILDEPC